MAGEKISPEVKRFIQSTINSAEQLEVLIFMMSNSDEEWTASQVSEQTRMPVELAEAKLKDLSAANLLKTSGSGEASTYRFSPDSTALAEELASSLERAYRERRDTLMQLVYSKPLNNIRIFADSFRIRRDD